MKKELSILLDKYYNGETNLEEEKTIREEVSEMTESDSVRDVFAYYESAEQAPEDVLEEVFDNLENMGKKRRMPYWVYSATAAAASLIFFLMAWGIHQNKINREQQFALMEEALVSVAEGLQPADEEQEMLVLWVDENVEIIIN